MLKSHISALAGLLALASALLASPPAPVAGTQPIAPNGDPALASRASRPRAAAFASALYPDIAPAAPMVAPVAPAVKLPEGYEVIVFAPHSPIRVKVAIQSAGKP